MFSSETPAVFESPAEPDVPSNVSCDSAQRTTFEASAPDLYLAFAADDALPFTTLYRTESPVLLSVTLIYLVYESKLLPAPQVLRISP